MTVTFNEERLLMTEFTDITYEVDNGLAWITINRPERYNALRARTLDELIRAFKLAWGSPEVGVICLTGAGEKAFCTGGEQEQRAETGAYGPAEKGLREGGPERRRFVPAGTRSSAPRPAITDRRKRACSRWIRCIGSSGTCRSRSLPP